MPRRLQRTHYREPLPPGSKFVARPRFFGNYYAGKEDDREDAIRRFIAEKEHDTAFRARVRRELAGYDLVCYCPLAVACHADVLLRWANE